MKRKVKMALSSLTLVSVLALGGAWPASADTLAPTADFGDHVSMMATEGHPLPDQHSGHMFGGCVSDMALGGSCPDMP